MISPTAEFVVSLTRDGRIATQRTIEDALNENETLMTETVEPVKKTEDVAETISRQHLLRDAESSKLIVSEEIALGHVSWPALKLYLSAMGGPGFWILTLGALLISDSFNTLSAWYLRYWTSRYEDSPSSEISDGYHLTI